MFAVGYEVILYKNLLHKVGHSSVESLRHFSVLKRRHGEMSPTQKFIPTGKQMNKQSYL